MVRTKEYLVSHGIRPSQQRMAVMSFLLNHPIHPTVDQIYSALCDSMPTLSRTTVYNTLKLLVERGAVASLGIDRTSERFDGDTSLHAHFMCEQCGVIEDIRLEGTGECLRTMGPKGEIRSIQLLYKGLCPQCKQTEALQNNN